MASNDHNNHTSGEEAHDSPAHNTTTKKRTKKVVRSEQLVFAAHPTIDPKMIWKLLSAFTETVPMTITPDDGIFVQVMDTSHSSMCEWIVPPAAFETFDIKHTHHFGITVPVMIKIMAAAGSGATITWTLDVDGDECINILAAGGKGIDITVLLRTCDIDQEIMESTITNWTRVCVSTTDLQRTVARLKGLESEMSTVCLHRMAEPSGVVVSVASTLLSRASASVSAIEMVSPSEKVSSPGGGHLVEGSDSESGDVGTNPEEHCYQATLLSNVLDCGTGISDRVWVCWKEVGPLLIKFVDSSVDADYDTKIGNLQLYIAPLTPMFDE